MNIIKRLIGSDPSQLPRNRDLGRMAYQDPAGVYITGGIVLPNGTYGGIYVYDGSTAQSITTGSTPLLLTCFNTAAGANGLSNDMTPVKASNKITVTRAGIYQIVWSMSFTTGTNAVNWEAYPFVGGVQLQSAGAIIYAGNTAQAECIAAHGYASIAANTDVDLRIYHNNGSSVNITVSHANINVTRVGN